MKQTKDEIHIVRALVKLNTALLNCDVLVDTDAPVFTGKLRRDITKFCEWYCTHTHEENIALVKASWTAYNELANYWFSEDFDEIVEASTIGKKHLALFMSKCKSAVNDLKKVEPIMSNKIIVNPIISRLENLFSNGYFKRTDIANSDINLIVGRLDRLGENVVLS